MSLRKKYFRYGLSFSLPIVIVLIVMIFHEITPFGDTSMLIWDAEYQYKDYYGYLWDILHGNASVEYFAGKSLGGKMIGLFCYYLSSPLNLLLLFFDKASIPLFLAVMTLLRIGLCGITSQFYFSNRFCLKEKHSILLSMLYALMEYNIYYCRNIMWLDGVIMLPLVLFGVYQLIYLKKKTVLWVSVSVAIIANWYTGYMVCLMAGVCYIYESILYFKGSLFSNIKNKLKLLGKFIVIMLGGVLTSMVILFPACLSLVGGKASGMSSARITGKINFNLLHFLRGFDVSGLGYNVDATMPLIFCGTLTLLLVIYYFFVKQIELKEKVTTALFLLILAASFCLHDLELLWTGLVESFSFFFRFAFVFSFGMLMIAAKSFKHIEEQGLEKKAMNLAIGTIIMGGIVLYCNKKLVSDEKILFVYLFALISIMVVMSSKICLRKIYLLIGICYIGTIAELTYNIELAFREYTLSENVYSEYVRDFQRVLDVINDDAEQSFYRLEKPYSYLTNTNSALRVATCESALFGYNSIEFYTSAYDNPVDLFLMRMGYSDWTSRQVRPTETYWNSPILLMDSLLSIKYAVLDKTISGYEEMSSIADKPFEENIEVYKNKYALPLGYNVSDNALEDMQYTNNPYDNQERFLNLLCGEEMNVYNGLNCEVVNPESPECEEYRIETTTDGPVYIYLNGSDIHANYGAVNCQLFVNGEAIQNTCLRFRTNSMYIGDFGKGEFIDVKIQRLTEKDGQHEIYASQLNVDNFRKAVHMLSDNNISQLSVQGNKIAGSYTTDKDSMVFLSIPYEDAWEAYIDGEKVSVENMAGMFLGVRVPQGTHDIYMVYKCPGLRVGFCMSLLGIGLFIAISLYEKGRVNKQ